MASHVSLFSRRSLVRGSIGGGLLLGLGGFGLALQSTTRGRAPTESLRVLSLDEYAIMQSVASRVCPQPAPDVPGADGVDVGVLVDRLLERMGPEASADVKKVLALFENGLVGALFLERTKPFTQLDPEAQDRVLLAWRDSSLTLRRSVYRALCSLTASMYYADPRTWPGIGYPGPPNPTALREAYAAQLVNLAALVEPGGEGEGA